MNRLRLDYQRSMQPFPVAGVALLAGAMMAAILAGGYYQRLTDRISSMEESLRDLEQIHGSAVSASRRTAEGAVQDISQANEVLRQLTLPWEDLFQAMETSTNREVTLLGMEPDTEKHVVNISCEARNINAMLKFVGRLRERKEFGGVYLQNHKVQDNDPERPVRFSLIAFWRAAT